MDSLYSRYANGLFSIALEENKVDLYRKRIKIIKNVFEENDDFLHLLSSCFISNEEKVLYQKLYEIQAGRKAKGSVKERIKGVFK